MSRQTQDKEQAAKQSRASPVWDSIRARLVMAGDCLMDWGSQQNDGVVVIAPGGPIDHENAGDFDARLLAAVKSAGGAGDRLVIDLSAVNYMSSAGLRVLAHAAREAQDLSIDLSVAGLRDTVAEIFAISRFDRLFKVFETTDAARKG
ncbi:MAG: STAS domain-containing protein [Alphaproteobacteria bacterium]